MPRSANCNFSQVRMWITCKVNPQGRTETLQWKFITQNIYRPFLSSGNPYEKAASQACVAYSTANLLALQLSVYYICILCGYLEWHSQSSTFVLHTRLLLAMRLTKYYICTLLVRANETLIFPRDSLPEICGPKTSFGCSTWTFLNLTNVLCISNIKTAKCNMEEYTMLDC
jgi:hypothetical protein